MSILFNGEMFWGFRLFEDDLLDVLVIEEVQGFGVTLMWHKDQI
jgi:hypothetical protein